MSSKHAESIEFQIRLSLKGNPPKLKSIQSSKRNHVVTVAPLMTMSELLDVSHEVFGVPKNNKFEIELWNGFPPKKIDLSDVGSLASLVTSNGISINDSLTIKIEKITGAKSRKRPLTKGNAGKSNVLEAVGSSSDPVVDTSSRPKRVSAQAATELFKDVIRAQDKMIRDEKQQAKSPSSKKTKPTASTPTAAQTAARKKAAEARAAAANARKLASLPGGRRLNDDTKPPPLQSLPTGSNGRRAKANDGPKSIFSGLNSEDDISFALISSIDSGSKRSGKVSKVLRGAMRKTVEKSYQASRAVVRNSAITSRKVTFSPSETQNGYNVRYPKGVEGVGFYEDQVHIITPLMLKAVVQAVYKDHDEENIDTYSGREMLKPQNMALLSPRVFWSLWYHYREQCSTIEEALNILLPDLDWAFLYCRSRQLSEKAKDNLRQEMAEKKEEGTKEDREAGIKAVQAVEKAMESMYDETVVSARERAAQAALRRFGNNTEKLDDWAIVTPTEIDEDELRECITECDDSLSEEVVLKCIEILVKNLTISNWRVLANAAPGNVHGSLIESGLDIPLDSIEAWISSAQTRSIDEIMLEILDGNQDLYAILRDELSSGTPKDLGLWAAVPELVAEEAETRLNASEDEVKKYCERAKQTCDKFEWVQLYSTPIN